MVETDRTAYSDSGLTAYTSYGYRVSAVNGEGMEGEKSESVEVRTLDGSPPEAPADLEAEAEGASEVELEWEAASDPESGVAYYRVYRDGTLVGEPEETECEDDGLEEASTRYRVSAVNGAGLEGSRTPPVTVRTDEENWVDGSAAPTAVSVLMGAAR